MMMYFSFPPRKKQKSGLLVEVNEKVIGGLNGMKFVMTNEK
jgi:hypothetical protein